MVFAARSGMPTIAVINSSEDTVGLGDGDGGVDDLKRGRVDFLKFLEAHDPRVIMTA